MLETRLAEVNQGELKIQHPEPLAHGRLLHTTIYRKNKRATMPPPSTRPPPRRPARPLPPATQGLEHHQMLATSLPRRHRQAGLDAKGVTAELLRLK
jgi:hypothetical protein